MSNKKFWIIEHYDSTTLIAEHKIPYGQISEKQLENLLKTLTAKHSLNEEETISSYLKKNTKKYNDFLEVTKSGPPYALSCGDNPYFIARVVKEVKPCK